jgi:hypothetical protein
MGSCGLSAEWFLSIRFVPYPGSIGSCIRVSPYYKLRNTSENRAEDMKTSGNQGIAPPPPPAYYFAVHG